MNRPNIPALTSLRFFAALLVVIFHYNIGAKLEFLTYVSSFGYESVTFFFVLSGFILTYVHLREGKIEKLNMSPHTFMFHRVARIAPAYFVALALAAPFFFASYEIHHTISWSLFVAGLILVPTGLQSWFPSTAMLWNTPAWSLSVELFLYASFSPLVFGAARIERMIFLIGAYSLVAAIGLALMYFQMHMPYANVNWWSKFFAYFPIWHLPQFILGVALGRLFISGRRFSPSTHEIIMVASLLTLGAIILYHLSEPFLSNNIVLGPVFGILIFGAAAASGPLSKALSARFLVLLGDASYATYIIHIPLWMWWHYVTKVCARVEMPSMIDFLCYLLIVTIASILVFLCIERPARRWLMLHVKHRVKFSS